MSLCTLSNPFKSSNKESDFFHLSKFADLINSGFRIRRLIMDFKLIQSVKLSGRFDSKKKFFNFKIKNSILKNYIMTI